MKLPPNDWPDTEAGNGAKFFFQLVRELVDRDTFESFRALTLDTLARLDEAIAVATQVQNRFIPSAALDPVYAELQWSLKRDPVAGDILDASLTAALEVLTNSKTSIGDQILSINYLRSMLRRAYKTAIERKIIENFSRAGSRLDIRRLTGFYCSHIINIGYSKAYIMRVVSEEFFSGAVQRVRPQLLERFFERFDGQQKSMHVIAPMELNTADFLRRLNYQVALRAQDLRFPSAIAHYRASPAPAYCTIRVMAYDEEGAVAQCEHRFNSLRAIALVNPRSATFTWGKEKFVIRSKASRGVCLSLSSSAFSQSPIELRVGGSTVKRLRGFAKHLNNSLEQESLERMLNSINTCALARSTTDREVQLISIWSAIEILLSAPEPNSVRILHYARHLVPLICSRYARRQLVAVCEALLLLHRGQVRRLIEREADFRGENYSIRFAAIVMLQHNGALRRELCELLSANPLALNRLAKIHIDLGAPRNLHDTIQAHADRVVWQLHRIYRARNNLVHAGSSPSFLESLILNAFEYYSVAVQAIVAQCRKNGSPLGIDQAVVNAGIQFNVQMANALALKKKALFDAADVWQLFAE